MKKITIIFLVLSFNVLSFAQTTNIPDPNFEQALIDLGIDTNGLNGNILNSDAAGVTYVNVDSKSIGDLTGIEAFTSLLSLYCSSNNLTSFDASVVPTLTNLVVWNNNLVSLNVNSNLDLYTLSCDENNLTSLDVSNLTGLYRLYCGSNSISTLDLSGNPDLLTLDCYGMNNLTTLDFTNNPNLYELYASNNQLTALDLSNMSDFRRLSCGNNNLSSLNVKNGNNTNVTYFNIQNNPNLTCVEVDDVAYSDTNWGIDSQAVFSTNCTASLQNFNLLDVSIYPNPTSGHISITSSDNIIIDSIVIYNIFGKKVMHSNVKNNAIDVSLLNSGVYYVNIYADNSKTVKKLIIE